MKKIISGEMKESGKKVLRLLCGIFISLTLLKALYYTHAAGGIDLRTRVVGARLFDTDKSPYFYKWQPGHSERYLDPLTEARRIVNGNVVTPATSVVIYPLSQLSYVQIRWIWTALQIIATVAVLYMLFSRVRTGNFFLTAMPVVIGLVCSDTWLMNVERGQMYLFYVLLITIAFSLYTSERRHAAFLSGFAGGIFILFRPFAAIVGLPFLLAGKWKWIAGCLCGFLAGCVMFVLPFRDKWRDYFNAMQEYVLEDTDQAKYNDAAVQPEFPGIIEHASNLERYNKFGVSRLDNTYHLFKRAGITITPYQSLIGFALVVLLVSVHFLYKKGRYFSASQLFMMGAWLMICAEIFIVAPRGDYNVIQWLFPLSLAYLRKKDDFTFLAVLITAFLFLHNFPFAFPRLGQVAEVLFFILTFVAVFSVKNKGESQAGCAD